MTPFVDIGTMALLEQERAELLESVGPMPILSPRTNGGMDIKVRNLSSLMTSTKVVPASGITLRSGRIVTPAPGRLKVER